MIFPDVTNDQLKAVLSTLGYVTDTDSEKWPSQGPQDGDYRWMGSWLVLRPKPWGIVPAARFHWSLTSRQQLEQAVKWALGELTRMEWTCAAAGHTFEDWDLYPVCPHCAQDAKNARHEVGR